MANIKQQIQLCIASIDENSHAHYYLPLFVKDIDKKHLNILDVVDYFYKLYKLTQFYTACESFSGIKTSRSHQTYLETINDNRGGNFAVLKQAINLYPQMDLYDWEHAQGSFEKIMLIIDNICKDDGWE